MNLELLILISRGTREVEEDFKSPECNDKSKLFNFIKRNASQLRKDSEPINVQAIEPTFEAASLFMGEEEVFAFDSIISRIIDMKSVAYWMQDNLLEDPSPRSKITKSI